MPFSIKKYVFIIVQSFCVICLTSCKSCDDWYEPESCTVDCLIVEGEVKDFGRISGIENVKLTIYNDRDGYIKADTLSETFTDENGLYRFSIPIDEFRNGDDCHVFLSEVDEEEYLSEGWFAYEKARFIDSSFKDIPVEMNFGFVPKGQLVFQVISPMSPNLVTRRFKFSYEYEYENEVRSLPIEEVSYAPGQTVWLEVDVPTGIQFSGTYSYSREQLSDIVVEDLMYLKIGSTDTIRVEIQP